MNPRTNRCTTAHTATQYQLLCSSDLPVDWSTRKLCRALRNGYLWCSQGHSHSIGPHVGNGTVGAEGMQCNPLFTLLMALVVPGHQDYGLHKLIHLHSENIRKIANWVMQWSLLVGSAGQAFAMLYIGINSAVNPTKAGEPLTGTSTFSIVCVYLFAVFYSFGWGPVPFVLSSECSPNHGEF